MARLWNVVPAVHALSDSDAARSCFVSSTAAVKQVAMLSQAVAGAMLGVSRCMHSHMTQVGTVQ